MRRVPYLYDDPETVFFGPRWGNPLADRPNARQTQTPVGAGCGFCDVALVLGDQGFQRVVLAPRGEPVEHDGDVMLPVSRHRVSVHLECELAALFGHDVGMCGCTGYEQTRSNALRVAAELYRRGRSGDSDGHPGASCD